jgi:hypothetical protein
MYRHVFLNCECDAAISELLTRCHNLERHNPHVQRREKPRISYFKIVRWIHDIGYCKLLRLFVLPVSGY